MAINKNRNLQFLRNSTLVPVLSHKDAVDKAQTKFATLPMEDGEIALYRYQIGENNEGNIVVPEHAPIHTIVGVAHVEGSVKNIEIIANYDHLTNIINALDANITAESATEVTDASHTYVKINVVEEDGVITGITLTENIDETIAARISEAIDGLDVEKVVVAKQENNVVTIYNVKEENGKIAQNGEAVVLEEVAFTGAAADVSVAQKTNDEGETIVAAGTVQSTLEAIATKIDVMDITHTPGTLVKVNFEQVDGKVTTFTTDESALETRLQNIENNTITGKKAIVVTPDTTTGNNEVSLKLAEETILTQDDNGLKATLSIVYNSEDKQIELRGVNGIIGNPIDATDFIKDGMLEDAEIITATNEEGLETGKRYIKFTFKTYHQGQFDEEGNPIEADLKVEYLAVEDLFDSYEAGNEWIEIDQTTNKISHKEVFTTEQQKGSVTTPEAAAAGAHVEFAVPTIKVDEAGHVIDITDTTVKVTLPASIATAVQTVTSTEAVNAIDKFVAVKATRTDNDVVLTSELKSKEVASATATDNGVALAADVKQFVLDNSASVAATEGQTTVDKSTTQPYVYTVGLANVAQTNDNTATSSFADASNTFTFIKAVHVDGKGRVTGVDTETVTENFDMGLYD